MTEFSSEISIEILEGVGFSNLKTQEINFTGLPVAHNLSFPIDEIMAGVQGAFGALIVEIWKLKTGEEQMVTIDIFHAYISISATLFVNQEGYFLTPWDHHYPTVGLYKTKDGRDIFLHGGHSSLRDKILNVLHSPNDPQHITAAVLKRDALELEEAIAAAAGCAAVVRDKDEWLKHPQGALLNQKPVLSIEKKVNSVPEPFPNGPRPLSGIRVLDLTHVIAAPTCSRILAEHGADVLHVTSPHLPGIPPFVMDTGHGKRQAYADLRQPEDLAQFKKLLSEADVFIEGWRPNIMAKFGLTPEEVQKIRPGIIHVTFSAYGLDGPWKDRAGWEQLSQAVTGIIDSNSFMISTPNGPVKFISDTITTHGLFICDYLSGYLGATAALAALIKRHNEGGGYYAHIALARSGMWAISKPASQPVERRPLKLPLDRPEFEQYLAHSHGPYGKVEFLAPSIQLSKTPPILDLPVSPHGSGKLEWLKKSV